MTIGLMQLQQCALTATKAPGIVANKFTVIMLSPEQDHYKVVFEKSQRIYKILKTARKKYIRLLRYSFEHKIAVIVERSNEQSDEIRAVKKAL